MYRKRGGYWMNRNQNKIPLVISSVNTNTKDIDVFDTPYTVCGTKLLYVCVCMYMYMCSTDYEMKNAGEWHLLFIDFTVRTLCRESIKRNYYQASNFRENVHIFHDEIAGSQTVLKAITLYWYSIHSFPTDV
jgi:hypothetical protein